VFFLGVVRAVVLADPLGGREHLAAAVVGDFILVGGEFDHEAVVVASIEGVEHAAVEDVVATAIVIERRHHFVEAVGIDAEGEVMHPADAAALGLGVRLAVVAHEERHDAAVAGVEKQVGLGGVVEVGLAQHQGHPEEVAVEGERVGLVAAPDGDVIGPGGVKRTVGPCRRDGRRVVAHRVELGCRRE
jgi:hypothetical protein